MECANVDLAQFLTLGQLNVKVKWRCPEYLVKMLEEGSHADITLEATDGSVKAHRVVLASVSPMFATDFTLSEYAGMLREIPAKKSADNAAKYLPQLASTMQIPDISIDALKVFLLLLYTTKDKDDGGIAELHAAIDKHFEELSDAFAEYQVDKLLASVYTFAVARRLNPDNCWRIYLNSILEDRSAATLCYNYILGNYAEVIKSDDIVGAMKHIPKEAYLVLRNAESHSLRAQALQKFESKKILASK